MSSTYMERESAKKSHSVELNDFKVIQKHEGRGMAIVIHKGLHSRPNSVAQQFWNCKVFTWKIQTKDTKVWPKSVPTYTQAASTKASLDFLEQIEDELGDTIVTSGDFNARSRMRDQQGNNSQGKALEEALGDVVFNPVITLLPTRLGSQGDTGSTTDLALVSQE